jgi:hypothetical protein
VTYIIAYWCPPIVGPPSPIGTRRIVIPPSGGVVGSAEGAVVVGVVDVVGVVESVDGADMVGVVGSLEGCDWVILMGADCAGRGFGKDRCAGSGRARTGRTTTSVDELIIDDEVAAAGAGGDDAITAKPMESPTILIDSKNFDMT